MTVNGHPNKLGQDLEITFLELLRVFAREKALLFLCASIGAVIFGALALVYEPKYEARMVAFVEEAGVGGSSVGVNALLSQFGAPSSAPGLSEAKAYFNSRSFATKFFTELCAENEEVCYTKQEDKSPSALAGQFLASVELTEIPRDSIINISLTWPNSENPGQIINAYVSRVNNHLKILRAEESKEKIDHLTSLLQEAKLVSVSQAASTLLQNEIQNLTFAEISSSAVMRVIDSAPLHANKIFPNYLVFVVMGFLSGLFLGCFLAVFKLLRLF